MIYRRLDASGDYTFGAGGQSFLRDGPAVAQAIGTRIKLLLGEWWEDIEQGLPLFGQILGVRATDENKRTADVIIQDIILNTQDVVSIQDYTSTISNRTMTLSCTVNTLYGLVALEVTV